MRQQPISMTPKIDTWGADGHFVLHPHFPYFLYLAFNKLYFRIFFNELYKLEWFSPFQHHYYPQLLPVISKNPSDRPWWLVALLLRTHTIKTRWSMYIINHLTQHFITVSSILLLHQQCLPTTNTSISAATKRGPTSSDGLSPRMLSQAPEKPPRTRVPVVIAVPWRNLVCLAVDRSASLGMRTWCIRRFRFTTWTSRKSYVAFQRTGRTARHRWNKIGDSVGKRSWIDETLYLLLSLENCRLLMCFFV